MSDDIKAESKADAPSTEVKADSTEVKANKFTVLCDKANLIHKIATTSFEIHRFRLRPIDYVTPQDQAMWTLHQETTLAALEELNGMMRDLVGA